MSARLPIVQYWDRGEPPRYLAERGATFAELNPEMERLLFDEGAAARFIAERIGEREAAAFRSCAVPTMQSDYFRYCAVYALGGVYADLGFTCRAPLRPLLESVRGGRLFSRGYVFSGLFMFGAAGHPLPRLVIDVSTANIERRVAELVQVVTGPWILTSLAVLDRWIRGTPAGRRVAARGIDCLLGPLCRRAVAMAPTAAAHDSIEAMVASLLDAVGDHTRLLEAFEGVRITPYSMVQDWMVEPEAALPYKKSERYWLNWQRERSIFR